MWKMLKIKNEDTRTMLLRDSSAFVVNCEHISSFVLLVEFKQANVCWVHVGKTNTFVGTIGYIMRYVAVFSVRAKFRNT